MPSKPFRRFTAACVTAAALILGAAPLAAQPWGPAAPAAAEAQLVARIWHWLSTLWSPGGKVASQAVSPATGPMIGDPTIPDYGILIDPNG